MRSKLEAADNSGAKILRCVKVLGGAKRRFASIGDTIVVSVMRLSASASASKVKKGDVFKAALVRTKKEIQREDGSILRFDVNSAVLLNKQGEPVGTRVFGPLPTELRKRGYDTPLVADIHFTPKQLHDMAVEHFQKKRLKPALEAVIQAIQLAPTSIKFSMSLLKIVTTMKEEDSLEDRYLEYADTALALFEQSKLEGKTAEAVEQVKTKWVNLFRVTDDS